MDDPTVHYRLVVSQEALPNVEIIHENIYNPFILFMSGISVSKEHQKKMSEMSFFKLQESLWKLRLNLLSMGVEFNMDRPSGGPPIGYTVSLRLFIEEASFQNLLDYYTRVKNGALYVIWFIQSTLDTTG